MGTGETTREQLEAEVQELRRRVEALETQDAEHRRARSAMRDREALARLALVSAGIGVWDWDAKADSLACDEMARAILGLADAEPMHLNAFFKSIQAADRSAAEEAVRSALRDHQPLRMEHRVIAPDGATRWVSIRGRGAYAAGGAPTRLIGIVHDETEQRSRALALSESEARYREIVENAQEGVWLLDADSNTEYVNPYMEKILGYSPGAMIGRSIFSFMDERGIELCKTNLDRRKQGVRETHDFEFLRTDGERVHVSIATSPIVDSDGTYRGALGLVSDITGRKRMELQLVRLERFRALGEMAAGISHNLNNILTGVLGPARFLQRATTDPEILEDVDSIVRSTLRATDLIRKLHMSTAFMSTTELQQVDVNHVVLEAVQQTRPRWKDEAEARGVTVDLVARLTDVPTAIGTVDGLTDVLVNLISNAIDAMPDGGTVTVGTQRGPTGVILTVSDTGVGMGEETRRRVFEPFFTTKQDVGSGLGLSTSYGAVSQWGGDMDVSSTPDKGSVFTIRLAPWTQAEPREGMREPSGAPRRGRLLLVDDDEKVRKFLTRLLAGDHDLVVVPGGQEALDAFAPGRFDVALVDLGMPGIPGDQVAVEMRRADPALVTVLITGWEISSADRRASPFDFKLKKPFESIDLIEDLIARALFVRSGRGA